MSPLKIYLFRKYMKWFFNLLYTIYLNILIFIILPPPLLQLQPLLQFWGLFRCHVVQDGLPTYYWVEHDLEFQILLRLDYRGVQPNTVLCVVILGKYSTAELHLRTTTPFWDRISLCSLGWPHSQSPCVLISHILGLYLYATMPSSGFFFSFFGQNVIHIT